MRLVSEDGKYAFAPLVKTTIQDKNYNIYTIKLTDISLPNGLTSLSIVDFQNNYWSTCEQINIIFDEFEQLYKACILAEIASDLAYKYQQIDEMTKLNIDIYKNIKEVTGK